MVYFDHEKLDAYQVARQLNREVAHLVAALPRGHSESKENLSRASRSVGRNIAEGAGRWRVADKVRFYHIARGSATECAACLDELVDIAGLSELDVRSSRELPPGSLRC